MKKMIFFLVLCGVLVAGGITATYAYLHYTDCSTYQNGIFVSRDVNGADETADCLYKSL